MLGRLKRIIGKGKSILRREYTPYQIAMACALGAMIGVVPIIGITTLVLGGLAFVLRIPFGITMTISFAVYPLQFLLLIPFYQLGSYWFYTPDVSDLLTTLLQAETFSLSESARSLGTSTLYALLSWLIVTLPAGLLIYASVWKAVTERRRRKLLVVEST